MNTLNEILKIADIHASRIRMALDDLKNSFPLDKETAAHFNREQLLLLELLTGRFAKLQDLMGKKIIDHYLQSIGEFYDNETIIDKINKLERIGIISDAQLWKTMRDTRNHIAHEYPDHPEITARYLNQLYDLAPKLLDILQQLKLRIKEDG